ncbi:hypothetical protein L9F63_015772, partial [Diploptera punctata]
IAGIVGWSLNITPLILISKHCLLRRQQKQLIATKLFHSKDTNMFTIEERIEIVAARLRGQSHSYSKMEAARLKHRLMRHKGFGSQIGVG